MSLIKLPLEDQFDQNLPFHQHLFHISQYSYLAHSYLALFLAETGPPIPQTEHKNTGNISMLKTYLILDIKTQNKLQLDFLKPKGVNS